MQGKNMPCSRYRLAGRNGKVREVFPKTVDKSRSEGWNCGVPDTMRIGATKWFPTDLVIKLYGVEALEFDQAMTLLAIFL